MSIVSRCHQARPAMVGVIYDETVPSLATVPLQVRNCSRIGLQANPPGYRLPFSGWFRRH
jgi:hypothetical protein